MSIYMFFFSPLVDEEVKKVLENDINRLLFIAIQS